MFIKFLIILMAYTLLHILANTTCDTAMDNLYIIVDRTTNINLTFTRVKHFLQYFIARRDTISHTPVYIIETFQRKVLTFSATEEIFNRLENFKTMISANKTYVDRIATRKQSFSFINKLIKIHKSKHEVSAIVIVWFTDCSNDCKETMKLFEEYDLQKVSRFLLFLHSEIKYSDFPISNTPPLLDIHLRPSDILRENDVVSFHLCKECPTGWKQMPTYNKSFGFKCYNIVSPPLKLSWSEATKQCGMIYSELPIIETFDELDFVITTVQEVMYNTSTESIENVMVHVGLTKSMYGNNIQWTNKRPFLLSQSINIKNHFYNCGVLNFTRENKSNEKYKHISWDWIDCLQEITSIRLCQRSLDDTKYRPLQILNSKVYNFKNKVRFLEKRTQTTEMEYKQLMFNCEVSPEKIISYAKLCDGRADCSNSRDEGNCGYLNVCFTREFTCINPNANNRFPFRQSYSVEAKCDTHQDCPDNSDEEGCDECTERRCSDGTCVPRHWLSSDGEKCTLKNSNYGDVYLEITEESYGSTHIEVILCNPMTGTYILKKQTNSSETFAWAPKCIFIRGRSGRPTGCNDLSHLHDCMDFMCTEEFIKCQDSYCIPLYYINDGVIDCLHGEDEAFDFFNTTCPFFCDEYNSNCIHYVNICDGFVHCLYGDDEVNCNFACPPGFECFESAVMVNNFSEIMEMKSLRIFDIDTKLLNLNGLDLSELNETYILPKLLELHASNCNLYSLEYFFRGNYQSLIFKIDLSYNKFTRLDIKGNIFSPYTLYLNLTGNVNLYSLYGYLDDANIDVSYTNISIWEIEYSLSNSLTYLNLSNTKLQNLDALNDISSIQILDIRNTMLSEAYTVNFLNKISIKSALFTDNIKNCCPKVVGKSLPREKCHAPFDNISSCENLIGDIFKRALLFIVATFSLVGNIAVLFFRIYYDRGILKKGYGVFVTNLGISDLNMGMYLTIIVCADIYFQDNYVLHETNWRASNLCKIAGFLSILSSETSTFFILLITLDRILVIRFPFGDYRLTKGIIIICVITSWVIGFILALIPIVYPEWTIYSSNGMCLGLPLTTDQQQGWQYSVGIFIIFNCILFLIISTGQIFIFLSMSSQRMTRNTINSSRREQDIDVAKQLFVVAMSNFLCWFPICVTGLMSINGHKVSPDAYAWYVIFVLPLNAALNPLIYTIPAIYNKFTELKICKNSKSQMHSITNGY